MNICINCKAEFIAKHKNQLYCSDECRKEARSNAQKKYYQKFKKAKKVKPIPRIIKCNSQYFKDMLNKLGSTSSTVSAILQEETGKTFATLMEDSSSLGDIIGVLSDVKMCWESEN